MMAYALGGSSTMEAIYEKYVSMVVYSTTRDRESQDLQVRLAREQRVQQNVGMSSMFAAKYLKARGYDAELEDLSDERVRHVAANFSPTPSRHPLPPLPPRARKAVQGRIVPKTSKKQ